MKETPLTTCEKQFISQAINEGQRLDGRHAADYRNLQISFGTEWGCCHVLLGNTRVVAQVSCIIQTPKSSRPNEGMLFINVELSTMAAEHFEAGRPGKLGIETTRLLERCIKDSRCVDLESLCILVEEKAWEIRVDVHVLNHDGNILDAATIAVLGALCHFRRPDITLDGRLVVVHTPDERDQVPLTILHYPLTLSFAVYNKGKMVILDPTNLEERCSDGKLIMGFNGYKELCALQLTGHCISIKKEIVLSSANVAASKANYLIEQIKKALSEDAKKRLEKGYNGLVSCVAREPQKVTAISQEESPIPITTTAPIVVDSDSEEIRPASKLICGDDGVVTLVTSSEEMSDSEIEMVHHVPAVEKKKIAEIDLGEESEEEAVILDSTDFRRSDFR